MGVPCIVPKITTYQPGWNWRLICSHRIVCLSLYEGGKLRQGMRRPAPDDTTHTQSPFRPRQQATAPGGRRHGAWNRRAPLRTLVDALSAARRQPFWAVGNHGGFRVSLKHSILQRQPVGCSLQAKTPVCLPLSEPTRAAVPTEDAQGTPALRGAVGGVSAVESVVRSENRSPTARK